MHVLRSKFYVYERRIASGGGNVNMFGETIPYTQYARHKWDKAESLQEP